MNECVSESGMTSKLGAASFYMKSFLVHNLFKLIVMNLEKILMSMSVIIYYFINKREIALIWRSSELEQWC